jgi:hypothetical protein
MGSEKKIHVNYVVRMIILKLPFEETNSSLIRYNSFENYRLKTAANKNKINLTTFCHLKRLIADTFGPYS